MSGEWAGAKCNSPPVRAALVPIQHLLRDAGLATIVSLFHYHEISWVLQIRIEFTKSLAKLFFAVHHLIFVVIA